MELGILIMKNETFNLDDLYKAWLRVSVLHPDNSPLFEDIISELKTLGTGDTK